MSAFLVSLVFSSNAYAADKVVLDDINISTKPSGLMQVSSDPVVYAGDDYKNGLFNNNSFLSTVGFYDINDKPINPTALYDDDFGTFHEIGTGMLKIKLPSNFKLNSLYINTNGDGIQVYFYKDGNLITGSYVRSSWGASGYYNFGNISVDEILISQYNSSNGRVREFELFSDSIYFPVSDTSVVLTDTTATLKWINPNIPFSTILVDGKDVGKSVTHLFKDLDPDTEYSKKITVVYGDGTEIVSHVNFRTLKEPDKVPPSEVSDFGAKPDKNFVDLSWDLPTDSDYAETWLYRNDVLIKKFKTDTTYQDTKLLEDTSYVYKLVTVDTSGNKSSGVSKTVLTKHTVTNVVPSAPILTGKELSKGARLMWNTPPSGTVKGYKIYMIDNSVASRDLFSITAYAASPIQVNTGLLASTSYQVSNLTNGNSYSFYVVAVNSSGLSSVPSNTVTVTPTASAVPSNPVDGGYDLVDVATSTTNWFGSIWLILAFAIGILLAFIIANRLKRLFFA